ncbi:MAG: flippase, partial [Lachnospiraceae bacterium]|nr:flippase [Lachnospiraceae bacterium]
MKKKSLKLNAILNIIKQLCSVIFPLITIPYISRILQSENYGKYNFGNSIISYFSLIAALGVSAYAVREGARIRDNKDKFSLFSSEVFTINVLSTVFSYILLVGILLLPTELVEYRKLIAIQSIVIFLTTLGADWINTIFEDYAYITIRYIVVQIVSVICMFIFVKKSSDYLIYALITVGANAGANIWNFFHVRTYVKLRLTKNINLNKHIIPMLMLFCNTVAVTVYVNSDTTILGFLDNDRAVGIYSISAKIYTIIKQLLNALIIVALPKLSTYLGKKKNEQYNSLINKIFNSLISYLFPVILGMFMLSYEIVFIISGKEYVQGSSVLKILSIALLFAVLACFFTNCIMLPCKQEKNFLKATVVSAIVNIGLNFLAIPLFSFNGAAITTVISECIVMLMSIKYTYKEYAVILKENTVKSTGAGCIFIVLICLIIKK